MTTTEGGWLDELVGVLDPVRGVAPASGSESKAARALFEEVVSMSPARAEVLTSPFDLPIRGRRRARIVALLAAALVVLGAAGGYAASAWLSPAQQLSAIDRLAQDIPLPPDGNFDAVRGNIAQQGAQQIEEAGLSGVLAFAATCQWYGYWLDGFNRGDPVQMSTAQRTIDAIPSWPQLAAVGSGSGGTVEYLKQLAGSADSGNAEPVRQFLTANCGAEPWGNSANG
ncbi:MAG: hypothetical protein M3Q23_12335 [Actinomycetota bacterium]|nr:hypothetical protein [Actinomycetota bacterium]